MPPTMVPTVTPAPVTVPESGGWSSYPHQETGQQGQIEVLEARIAELEQQVEDLSQSLSSQGTSVSQELSQACLDLRESTRQLVGDGEMTPLYQDALLQNHGCLTSEERLARSLRMHRMDMEGKLRGMRRDFNQALERERMDRCGSVLLSC
jgi:hypothetical protein